MAGVFHVEFGINETPLTRALENNKYVAAERIIRNSNCQSYLDEGCYQRTPLFICLCGVDEEEQRVRPRNLYLAKLLIENGANVNLRVPTTYGSEYEGPGKSALELLSDFYNDLTKHGHFHNNEMWTSYHGGWDPHVDVVVGLHKQYLSTLEDVIEHVEDMIFVILSNGGNPNICDAHKMTPLHRHVMISLDDRLLRLLCENGAQINAKDSRGNTPLLSLCDICATDVYDYLEDLSPSSDDTLEDISASMCVKQTFLNFMLSSKSIDVNCKNNRGQTALFHCVIRGDVSACQKLLKSGADPSVRGTVWETRKRKRILSPIFATFLSIPLQRTLSFQNMHYQLAISPGQYGHLVDAGYFNRKEIKEELDEYLDQDFPEFSHLKSISHKLVPMMFGKTTASLKQLSARSIFHHCFLKGGCSLGKLVPSETLKQRFSNADLKQMDVYDEYINLVLNRTVLKSLIERLNVPLDSLVNFEVELLLHQMSSRFSAYKVLPPENYFCGQSDESFDSDDSISNSPDEGDSDLEYW